MTRTPSRTPSVLAAELYPLLLPAGHLLYVQVVGALIVGFGVWKVGGQARVAGSQRAAVAVPGAPVGVTEGTEHG